MDITEAFRLTGKVALVTGGGSGIGEASATVLAAAGARVVVADVDGEAAERVAKDIANGGGDAIAAQVDVADRAAVENLVAKTVNEAGRLDVLLNNAGIMRRRPLLEVSTEEFRHLVAVNLESVLHGTQAAARVMEPGSSIINTLSTIIDFSTAGTGTYTATKKGAEALTRTFAVELGPRGIRVNGIAPGWTKTGMTRAAAADDAAFGSLTDRMSSASPLAGITEPVDSAYAVLYLAAPASRFVTGHVIRVNGGMSMA
ncbi:beta-ketoacyl-ACP reductase [Amycolatopsis sp. NBRC 101858]|uniref:SDR family NAD(P)-dependent oxidoreductase n=1 Tax=Amycolatopsis sp. NBRC 101858 TaxID=3032200 RepID=UPI0024A15864|nr:SDR family oxidoreductase [Amycolatopsis sp. NBRC 101858]GLY38938.1 beta-ketoacyl-ACP reductase [Amycolatopsis sp. NBRC 101858]